MCKISPSCLLALVSLCLAACAQQGYTVIAASNTTIGVGISQSPTNGSVDATLGYKRQEIAFVPTNRLTRDDQTGAGGEHAQGAKDTGNVIMEIRHSGIFSMGENSGIYQRLAVGDVAVREPGASMLFAKGHDGALDAQTKQAIVNLASVPSETAVSIKAKSDFYAKYSDCDKKNNQACIDKMKKILDDLKVDGIKNLPIVILDEKQVEILKTGL
jgi:hypothetical protein